MVVYVAIHSCATQMGQPSGSTLARLAAAASACRAGSGSRWSAEDRGCCPRSGPACLGQASVADDIYSPISCAVQLRNKPGAGQARSLEPCCLLLSRSVLLRPRKERRVLTANICLHPTMVQVPQGTTTYVSHQRCSSP